MPSFLDIVAIVGIVGVSLLLLFLAQSLIAPRLITGTLSEAVPEPCNNGSQWVLYDCKPNPLTHLGCVVPGSGGKFLTYKTIAVLNSTCQPGANGDVPGTRVISFRWQIQGKDGVCSTPPVKTDCCDYNAGCTRKVTYLCVRTTAPEGGESQCTPEYLPIPYPGFDPADKDYTDPANAFSLEIPCRENFCGVPVP